MKSDSKNLEINEYLDITEERAFEIATIIADSLHGESPKSPADILEFVFKVVEPRNQDEYIYISFMTGVIFDDMDFKLKENELVNNN